MNVFGHTQEVRLPETPWALNQQFNTPGLPGYGHTYGMGDSLPFPYDPATDTYYGFRWDFDDNGKGYPGPLTEAEIKTRSGLYLTSHPYFYESHWLKGPGRLTKVFFKRPKHLQINNIHRLFKSTWSGNFKEPTHFQPTETAQKMLAYGFNAFYQNHIQEAPELFLVNPAEQVTGAVWQDFEPGQYNEYHQMGKAVIGLCTTMQTLFDNPAFERHSF